MVFPSGLQVSTSSKNSSPLVKKLKQSAIEFAAEPFGIEVCRSWLIGILNLGLKKFIHQREKRQLVIRNKKYDCKGDLPGQMPEVWKQKIFIGVLEILSENNIKFHLQSNLENPVFLLFSHHGFLSLIACVCVFFYLLILKILILFFSFMISEVQLPFI